jgi:divalent metal cation (Fe/Co/Zn/Cd) transporter
VIVYNGIRLLLPALNEVMDGAVSDNIGSRIKAIAATVEGVLEIEKCRIRKSDLGLLMDIHVIVREDLTVHEGHKIGHEVKNSLLASDLNIMDVTVHIEPGDISTPE